MLHRSYSTYRKYQQNRKTQNINTGHIEWVILVQETKTQKQQRVFLKTSRLICTTEKYTKAFHGWYIWMSSKPLFNLLNSSWKSTRDQHNFQYFRFLTKGRSLLTTQEERNFTAKKRLCSQNSSYETGDGKPRKIHLLYNDVKRDHESILENDIKGLL